MRWKWRIIFRPAGAQLPKMEGLRIIVVERNGTVAQLEPFLLPLGVVADFRDGRRLFGVRRGLMTRRHFVGAYQDILAGKQPTLIIVRFMYCYSAVAQSTPVVKSDNTVEGVILC